MCAASRAGSGWKARRWLIVRGEESVRAKSESSVLRLWWREEGRWRHSEGAERSEEVHGWDWK